MNNNELFIRAFTYFAVIVMFAYAAPFTFSLYWLGGTEEYLIFYGHLSVIPLIITVLINTRLLKKGRTWNVLVTPVLASIVSVVLSFGSIFLINGWIIYLVVPIALWTLFTSALLTLIQSLFQMQKKSLVTKYTHVNLLATLFAFLPEILIYSYLAEELPSYQFTLYPVSYLVAITLSLCVLIKKERTWLTLWSFIVLVQSIYWLV